MADHAGVLNLAGEFVHSYYQLVVSDQFAGAVDFYSENAVLTRGIGGTRATSSQSVATEISAMHSKLKEGTAEIVSIDAVQLESQNIVIAVSVAFKTINTVVSQTLVLEAKPDEDGQALWFIANDMLRYLPSNALVGPSASKGGPRVATGDKGAKSAKNTASKAAETAAPVSAASTTETPAAAAPAQASAASVAPVASNTAVAAPAAETKTESAPVSVQTHVTKPKTERTGKKTATSGAEKTSTNAAPAAAPEKAAPKKEEPKSWAARVAAAASAAPATTEETKAPATSSVPVVATTEATEKPHRHANVTATATVPSPATSSANASSSASTSNDLLVFIRAPAALTVESIKEKFSSFGTVTDLELKNDKTVAIIAIQAADKEAVFTQIAAASPITINGVTLSTVEKSRNAPNARASSGSRGPARGGRTGPSASSPSSSSPSNGREAPRGGRRPAGGNVAKKE